MACERRDLQHPSTDLDELRRDPKVPRRETQCLHEAPSGDPTRPGNGAFVRQLQTGPDDPPQPERGGPPGSPRSPCINSATAYLRAQTWQKEPLSVPAISFRPVTYAAFIRAYGA